MLEVPIPFQGTPAEAQANFISHRFVRDGVCERCDTMVYQASAYYPCGADVPRMEVETDEVIYLGGRPDPNSNEPF